MKGPLSAESPTEPSKRPPSLSAASTEAYIQASDRTSAPSVAASSVSPAHQLRQVSPIAVTPQQATSSGSMPKLPPGRTLCQNKKRQFIRAGDIYGPTDKNDWLEISKQFFDSGVTAQVYPCKLGNYPRSS